MPSKGIDCYTYISLSLASSYEVVFTVPKDESRHNVRDNFSKKHLEVESDHIPGEFSFVGRFEWKVYHDGIEIATKYNDINALTGNLHGGTMIATQSFTPIVTDEVIITYGFYDAGKGEFGLPSHDQCYITICSTENQSWMGAVAPEGSEEADKPFSRFALVAPHDNGMNSMQTSDEILQAVDGDMVKDLKEIVPNLKWFDHLPDEVIAKNLPNIVYGVSITQKKEIEVMLSLGARYFEFRPAELLPMFQKLTSKPNKFYFHHMCIPGLAFDEFLATHVSFLDAHPTEITVIHIRHDNIVKECKLPTEDEVKAMLTDACSKSPNNLTWGDSTSFTQPISTLRSKNRRLVLIFNALKYDSWTAPAYATLHAGPILSRFESMNTAGQLTPEAGDLTVLQCQATSQSIKEVFIYSVISANAATSCLTATKGELDTQTLPWIRKNAAEKLKAEKLLVIMNDFIDGATCDTGIEVSRKRLAWESAESG